MKNEGKYTGLSFPFRIDSNGGITMSTTTPLSSDHIDESIAQILLTRLKERPMELDVGSDVHKSLFSPTGDQNTYSILRYSIVDALTRLEPRITVKEDDVTIVDYENAIYAQISYTINNYGNTYTRIYEIGKVE